MYDGQVIVEDHPADAVEPDPELGAGDVPRGEVAAGAPAVGALVGVEVGVEVDVDVDVD